MADLQRLAPSRRADVTLINRADPLLLKQIAEHARLVHGTPREFDAFKLYAFKRYRDHRRYLDLEREYVDRALERILDDARPRTGDAQAPSSKPLVLPCGTCRPIFHELTST